ncbi:MAG: TetR/AcrR family transcriptional regulator [Terrimesophilobacter sp.]
MAQRAAQREKWVDSGLDALAEGGPEAVRVERLAQRMGVTKGGFYGYFANREALLEAMLDSWEHDSTRAVVEQVDSESLGEGARAFRAAQLTWAPGRLLNVDLAVREWARRDARVAARLAKVDRYRMDYLRQQMQALCDDPREVEARTLIAFSSILGMHYAGIVMEASAEQRQDTIDLLTSPDTFRPPWRS